MKWPGDSYQCGSRRASAGNALLEFILCLPIIIFMTGLTMYMSLGMLTMQQTIVAARHSVWRSANNQSWSDMRLESWVPEEEGPPTVNRPRGEGEELERWRPEVEPGALENVSGGLARSYWPAGLWENFPGRRRQTATRHVRARGSMWDFIERSTYSKHERDSSTWIFRHMDAWRIARSEPLREIFEAFRNAIPPYPDRGRMPCRHPCGTDESVAVDTELRDDLPAGVTVDTSRDLSQHDPPGSCETDCFFEETRDDIMARWWHGWDLLKAEDGQGGASSQAGG